MSAIGRDPSIVDELRESITAIADRHSISLAVLFGSRAKGLEREESDIDLAVALEHDIGLEQEMEILKDLSSQMKQRLDLIILNRADALLLHEVVRTGRPVYQRTGSEFSALSARAVQRMNDSRWLMDMNRQYVKDFLEGVRPSGARS